MHKHEDCVKIALLLVIVVRLSVHRDMLQLGHRARIMGTLGQSAKEGGETEQKSIALKNSDLLS